MKLTLKIKLLPTEQQANLLLDTIKEANTVCDTISNVAWKKKIFNNYKLHHEIYYPYKAQFNLSSQMLIRQIAKVANTYKLNKKTKHTFKPLGAITYDSRLLTYKPNNIVSLWCIGGRQKINFVCHNSKYIPYIKGEADLVYKKGKFYIFQTVDVPEEDIDDVEEFIGIDLGITDVAVSSDGVKHSADGLNKYREHRQKIRSSIQSKCTKDASRSTKKNCRKLLKRLQGKERTHANIVNHIISKSIVKSAKENGKGIALEDLTNIRFTSKRRNKKFRSKLGKWSFGQLRNFISYKAQLNGVPLVIVPPAYTSQTCHVCKNIGKRTNKTFKCVNPNCKVDNIDADYNAANIISLLGAAINQPKKPNDMCCSIAHVYSGLKPSRSLVGG